MEPDCFPVKVTNLNVKKFRRVLDNKSQSSFQIYQVVIRGPVSDLKREQKRDHKLKRNLD